MSAKITATACGLVAALTIPVHAQDSSATAPTGSAEQTSGSMSDSQSANGSDAAKRQAEQAGMQNVQSVEGASVLTGSSRTNAQIFMIVGPAGDLLAIAAPLPGTEQTGAGSSAGGTQGGSGDMPEAGEPAESGFMATQTQPATPNMWDPAAVERGMEQLELGTRGAAGEVSEQ